LVKLSFAPSRVDGAIELLSCPSDKDTGPMHVAATLGTPIVVPFDGISQNLPPPDQPGDARLVFSANTRLIAVT
jgi:hypothetical protein